MSEPIDLQALAHAKFQEAFGKPHNRQSGGDHWSLRPFENANVIHVMLNGTRLGPNVWVFDPHDQDDGIFNSMIDSVHQIEASICKIRDRLESATQRQRAYELARDDRNAPISASEFNPPPDSSKVAPSNDLA